MYENTFFKKEMVIIKFLLSFIQFNLFYMRQSKDLAKRPESKIVFLVKKKNVFKKIQVYSREVIPFVNIYAKEK